MKQQMCTASGRIGAGPAAGQPASWIVDPFLAADRLALLRCRPICILTSAKPVTRASPRAPFGRIGRFLENDARQGSGHGEVDDQSAVLALDDREAPRLELVEFDEGDIAKR